MTISLDDLMDAIVANDSPSKISDTIKDMLYAKSADLVNNIKPDVASSLFGTEEVPQVEDESDSEETVAVATPEVEDEE